MNTAYNVAMVHNSNTCNFQHNIVSNVVSSFLCRG